MVTTVSDTYAEEIKTFDIEIAKMLYSMLDGKLSMKYWAKNLLILKL